MKTAADILANKKASFISIESNQTIYQALEVMNTHKVGAVVVTKDHEIVGIWTERDLMQDIMKPNYNIREALMSDYMTTELLSAPIDSTINDLKEIILSNFIRHILIKKDEQYVGLLSVGDIIRASLMAQDEHIEALKSHTSWHYYESWGWDQSA